MNGLAMLTPWSTSGGAKTNQSDVKPQPTTSTTTTTNQQPTPTMSLSGNHEYRDFMEKLAEANVGEYIDLPMIAVMGDTSSGKSSLLSMISTVELPSSDKLTTRCPTLLDMTKSTEKRAEVSIQWKDGTKGKHFNPIEIGASNWDQLTESIRKAQEFIIKATGKEVSRNVVRVKMFGPECEDLS
eukprot:CAMPEP_0198136080 /NCGR_PEP_ID=MMETSP1442-20131203/60924_1 /TAXON_ID= /ORGANISM="Craspedostauros australis, Strain CCMP3328" /LENGTH=183 /DNA_ID=CAMNT_0043797275 /DNA_START=924 /DNA_END=1472 /DNA_ORIENTATION=-